MYISGSWLRLFIKNHANTLPQVELERMVLTDGTWRSIARGLAKLRHLSALFSCGQLYQKQSATLVIRMPAGVSVHPSISLNGHAQTQQFLLAWLEHFHTDPCPPSTWDRALLPQYHEVCFSKPNDLYMDRDKSTWRKRTTPLLFHAQSSVTSQHYILLGHTPHTYPGQGFEEVLLVTAQVLGGVGFTRLV